MSMHMHKPKYIHLTIMEDEYSSQFPFEMLHN